MKKLISVLVVALALVLTFSFAASASDEVYYADAEGLFDIEYAFDSTVADGTMFGMVVIEAAPSAAFALTEDNIRYIDQVNAKDGKLTFADFAPMDLKETGTKYLVYIGGGDLGGATKLGMLSLEPLQYYDIVFMNGTEEVKKVTKIVGETLKTVDFPTVPSKTGYTGKWSITTDITGENTDTITVNAVYEPIVPTAVTLDKTTASLAVEGTVTLNATVEPADALYELEWSSNAEGVATVADGVVTAVAAGEAKITVTVKGTDIKAECVVTVTEKPAYKLGDIDGSGKVNSNDAIYLLEYTFDDELPVFANTDVDGSGKTNSNDAIYLLEYTFDDSIELH